MSLEDNLKAFIMKEGDFLKQIKVILVAMIFGSFVFLYNHQEASAASISETEAMVKNAESWAGALKWAISVEGKDHIEYPDMNTFNNTKSAFFKAKEAVSTLPQGTQKASLEERLENGVEVHYTRAIAYIDAITSGKKIREKELILQEYITSGNIDGTTTAYHLVTAEIRKQAELLYRVYGKSTRDAILREYKVPAESLVRSVIYEVTVNDFLSQLDGKLSKGVSHEYLEDAIINFKEVSPASPLYNPLSSKLNSVKSKVEMTNKEIKDRLTSTATIYGIPPEVLKAIAFNENGFKQFGPNFEPHISTDNGIGLMQVTVDPAKTPYSVERLKFDTAYNIQVGAEILRSKWRFTGEIIPTINNGDASVLENWYFAIMAYNGLSKVNDPTLYNETYQQKIYSYISNYSDVNPELLSKDDILITYENGSNIMYFTRKMNYVTAQKTRSTQMYVTGDTIELKDYVRFRTEPSTTSGEVISTLPKGTKLTIQSSFINDNAYNNHYVWYKVSLPSGQTGYVASVSF
jgi:soluble lytic murein transglycosylase-like protein